ncbi:hypothetical protein [Mesoplasma corruscae]|nr:hypothetical protein [Mesoplasma corruscae]
MSNRSNFLKSLTHQGFHLITFITLILHDILKQPTLKEKGTYIDGQNA